MRMCGIRRNAAGRFSHGSEWRNAARAGSAKPKPSAVKGGQVKHAKQPKIEDLDVSDTKGKAVKGGIVIVNNKRAQRGIIVQGGKQAQKVIIDDNG